MSSFCPYCHSTRSILVGNVYCSKHGPGMKKLDNGALLIKTQKLEETDWHVSRLSIRCMIDGEQYYKVGNKESTVTPDNFQVINQGQSYKTAFEGDREQTMLLAAFKPGFAEGIFDAMTKPSEWLLDNPTETATAQVNFFEKTYDQDPQIKGTFTRLHQIINDDDEDYKKCIDKENLYGQLVERLISLHFDIYQNIDSLSQVKRSTKLELFKRLSIAKDYMDSYYITNIQIDKIAEISFLSVSHFKRLFKEYYGISPHQYIINKRLEKAKQLLSQSDHQVQSVCNMIGLENTFSFIRLFKENYNITPLSYRTILSKDSFFKGAL